MENTRIRWSDSTWNPMWGCTVVSPGCDNCVDPSTRILYADGTWRPIGEAHPGDDVIAFDEDGPGRRLRAATVTQVRWTRQAAMRFVTPSAQIVCSGDHRWLTTRGTGVGQTWRHASRLTLGTQLHCAADAARSMDKLTDAYAAGYIVGATLGDGTYRYEPGQLPSGASGGPQAWWRVAVAETDRAILDRLVAFCARFDVTVHVRPFNSGRGGAPMLKVETRALGQLATLDGILNDYDAASSDDDWAAGWVAGLFDTDGSGDGSSLRIAQRDTAVLDVASRYLRRLGFDSRIETYERACPTLLIRRPKPHGSKTLLEFVTRVRPALLRKVAWWDGRQLDTTYEPVLSIEALPVRTLVDIATTSGTFIAEGLATHNCYAEVVAERFGHGFDTRFKPHKLDDPRRWRRPRRIFTNSMSDVFHADFTDDQIRQVFDVMAGVERHDFLLLTKRPQRMARFVPAWLESTGRTRVPLNIWLGVSIESDRYVWRADWLRGIDVPVRFLSCEPLLGPLPSLDLTGIAWVIVGGESGPGFRPMDHGWAADLRDRTLVAGAAFYFKQSAAIRTEMGVELDGERWEQYPLPHPTSPARVGLSAPGVWADVDPQAELFADAGGA